MYLKKFETVHSGVFSVNIYCKYPKENTLCILLVECCGLARLIYAEGTTQKFDVCVTVHE